MGLFSFFSKKQEVFEAAVSEIAKAVSMCDKAVIKEIHSCVTAPKKYAANHSLQYLNRGIDIEGADNHTLMWIGLADCLIKHGYAQEFDWKCGKDDFVGFMSILKSFDVFGCEINPVLLYDDDDVSAWCAAQDKVWYTKQLCIGGIDIDSDSYVLFVSGTDTLEKLRKLASSIHQRIARGSEL